MNSWCAHVWGCLWLISQPKEETLSPRNPKPSRYFGELTHPSPSFESSITFPTRPGSRNFPWEGETAKGSAPDPKAFSPHPPTSSERSQSHVGSSSSGRLEKLESHEPAAFSFPSSCILKEMPTPPVLLKRIPSFRSQQGRKCGKREFLLCSLLLFSVNFIHLVVLPRPQVGLSGRRN